MKTHWRAVDLFTSAANRTLNDCRAILAEQSANGALRSGNTAKRAVDAFAVRTSEALDQILDEVARRVEHRGRRWRKEMGEVRRALNEHLASAPEVLETAFKAAGADQGSKNDALMSLLERDAAELRKRHAAFRDGWTAPLGKRWQERHPVWYALALVIFGAVVGQVAPPVAKIAFVAAGWAAPQTPPGAIVTEGARSR